MKYLAKSERYSAYEEHVRQYRRYKKRADELLRGIKQMKIRKEAAANSKRKASITKKIHSYQNALNRIQVKVIKEKRIILRMENNMFVVSSAVS